MTDLACAAHGRIASAPAMPGNHHGCKRSPEAAFLPATQQEIPHEHPLSWRRQHRLAPKFDEYPNGNEEPRRVLRLNVYFDNPVQNKDGAYDDRGGFWAPVDWWHRDAERWATLFAKGMRVAVRGHLERDDWTDGDGEPHTTYKVDARSVGILPYRLDAVHLSPKPGTTGE